MTELKEDAAQWAQSRGQPVTPKDGPAPRAADVEDRPFDTLDEDEFMRLLVHRLRDRLNCELDPEVQAGIGKLINLLIMMRPATIRRHRALFVIAFDVFTAEKPNMVLAHSIWRDLMIITDRSGFGLARLVSFVAGSTALSASISALLAAGFFSFVMLFVMVGGDHLFVGHQLRASGLLRHLQGDNATQLVIVVHAAFMGGIISILARVQNFVNDVDAGPVLVFISVFRKPFLGAAFAVLVFCTLKAGILTVPGVSLDGSVAIFTVWTLGFVCGFSERFASDIILEASNRFVTPMVAAKVPGSAPVASSSAADTQPATTSPSRRQQT